MTIRGVIHGKTIILSSDPGLADGSQVEVVVRPLPPAERPISQGFIDSFGGWDDDIEGLDKYIEQVYRDRASDRRNQDLDE